MKITFEGSLADIKQEMQDFLAGAATPVVDERKSVEEEMVRVMTGDGPREIPKQLFESMQEEPVVYDDPAPKIDYPPRTKAETQALMREVIKKPQGRETAIALLARFGVTKFKDLAEEHYAEFYVGLESVK
ncbi:hypothetical protein NHG32_02505 [Aerococcaceae bacterium NML191219]|nr:hypothetical protein [Aerococcaceae bacterium NML191219]